MNSITKMLLIILKTLGKPKVPKGFTSRDIVERAIEFNSPPRIPYILNTHKGDFMYTMNMAGRVQDKKGKKIGDTYIDEWGITWEITGKGWDHAKGYPLEDLENLDSYKFPEYQFDKVNSFTKKMISMGKKRGKYVLGVNSINMYEQLRSLMGFEGVMIAPYLQPEKLRKLIDKLADMTCSLIDNYILSGGIDGFITLEDWGLQVGLQMSIKHFREFYKPVYQRIIDYCHKKNIHFFWHSCGDIISLIPEMVEINVDVVQMDQPRLMGYENIIEASQGKLCFFNCVDNQWSARPETTIEEIIEETEKMIDVYSTMMPNGGLIVKHYPQPWDIGLSKEKELVIAETFFRKAKIDH